jgi:glycopeptide antibiotics resistance protein
MQSAYELLRDVATFVPVGALACRQWPAATSRAKVIGGGGAGIAFVAGIEAAQTLVLSRITDVTDIITGGLGIAIGVLVAGHRRDAHRAASAPLGSGSPTAGRARRLAWLVAFAIGYTALLFVAAWHPFEFNFDPAFLKPRVQSFVAPPLTTLYHSPEFAALTNAMSHIAWFVPLGVLADWCSRRGATHAATRRALLMLYLLLVLAAAAGMEAGQIAIPARTASLDGVILRALGAGVGVAASRFLAPTRHRNDAG